MWQWLNWNRHCKQAEDKEQDLTDHFLTLIKPTPPPQKKPNQANCVITED